MNTEESVEERQENELEVLKAIYSEDLQDLRIASEWNKWHPLNLKITLTPQQGNSGVKEVHAKLDLHIICSDKYPDVIPEFILENSRGLSNAILMELRTNLEEKARSLQGEVMIFELAQYVQAFLHRHNKPGTKSFYEEMLIRQQEKELREKQAQQIEEDKARQEMVSEVAKRQEILMQANKLRREQRIHTENSSEDDAIRRRSSSCTETEDYECIHKGVQSIKFLNNGYRLVQRGRCISHSESNSVLYSGMDADTGEIVVISEWVLRNNNADCFQLQRQISSIEQECNYLVKLKHNNLAHYYNIKYDYMESENKMVVHILKEFVFGSNCTALFICESISVDIDMLQHIASGILSALDFLHRNNVVHKEISDSCVFINKKGIIKVANYSLDRRLSDLVLQRHSSNYGKKTDIHKFGILLLSLMKGTIVSEGSCEIPQNIPNELYDFLSKCLAKEDKDRFTAMQLLNHSFLRRPVEKFSPKANAEEALPDRNDSPDNQAIDFKMLAHSNSVCQSRVQSEFEILDWLGKGAFGEVFKVKNNLDQGCYAIKKIELNPKNKQLNKKIIREVKLLSKLNHENVVRYYNSWIESAVIERVDSAFSTSTASNISSIPKVIRATELAFQDDIELLAPPVKDVEWSISYEGKSKGAQDVHFSDDDSSDEDEDWGLMLNVDLDESDSIEFTNDVDTSETLSNMVNSNPPIKSLDTVDSVSKPSKEVQFMYIQMEFCEKCTLRTAIDNGLYKECDRVWRLFREIVEGLAHIHQQGMIHRDLKPVNIFLDSNDHVKIGDFGLATTNFLSRISEPLANEKESSHECVEDGSMTGHVGTALYVAPELSSSERVAYNQKVDIFSLGIILFEMCYKPVTTAMERIKILSRLRTSEILFPADFKECGNEQQELIIRWLLDHNVSERPSSQQVLQSDHIPPPVLEEFELRELVRHTLSNPHLKAYKYLVESCFKQRTTSAQDITYDQDPSIPYNVKNVQVYDYVKKIIVKVFNLHGGQNLSTPLLMPKSKYYEDVESCTKLMTHSGCIVSVPHDLRVPFARYVAWNGISLFRRFSIERVYREKKVFGYLPRELYECAFDIVTPTAGNFMSDAELLYILNELMDKIPPLKNKNFLIRLNHTLLLRAILLHCGIKEKQHEVTSVLSEARDGKVTKFQVRTHLISLDLSDYAIDTLFNLLELEAPITKIVGSLQMITKKKSTEASQLAKQALQELKVIIQNAELLGVQLPIVVAPGLLYNIQQYSGMMCQLTCELKKKHKHGVMNVLAAGGRYDNMIASYRNIIEQANMLGKDVKQSAVGISLSLDKIIQAVQKEQAPETNLTFLDAVICSVGTKTLLREKSKILTELWSAGIRCSLIDTMNLEDIQEQCSELNVPHVIILKDTEQGSVRVRSWERDRFQEKKVKTSEIVDNMQRIIKSWNESNNEQGNVVNNLNRSDSKSSYSERCEHNHDVNVLFVTADEKLSANTRKRYENQIRSQLDNILKRLNGEIIILAINVDANVLRTAASYLDFETEAVYTKSVEGVIERHQRHKKYLLEICDEIYDQKTKRSSPIVILYSLNDSFYRIL